MARSIWQFLTDHNEFIKLHFTKQLDAHKAPQMYISFIGNESYLDPLLTWSARYNHLWIIEWLINSHYHQMGMINYDLLELNHKESILHILCRDSYNSPRHQTLVKKLITETDISGMHTTEKGKYYANYINVDDVEFLSELRNINDAIATQLLHAIFSKEYQPKLAMILLDKIIWDINECCNISLNGCNTIPHAAVRTGRIDLIRKILERYDFDISRIDIRGNNVLHLAVLSPLKSKRKQTVIDLLFTHPKMYQFMHKKNANGWSAYDIAIDKCAFVDCADGVDFDEDIGKRLQQYQQYYFRNDTNGNTSFVNEKTWQPGVTFAIHPITQCNDRTYYWDQHKMYQI